MTARISLPIRPPWRPHPRRSSPCHQGVRSTREERVEAHVARIAPACAAVYFQHEPMIEIRLPRTTDAPGCAELAATAIGPDRAGPFIKSHMEIGRASCRERV